MIADNDLVSMQHARILAENAREAFRKLAELSQEKLDEIAAGVAEALDGHAAELAELSHRETGYGRTADKTVQIHFACRSLVRSFRGMRCVGVIREDARGGVLEVGVPYGVIAALCPSTAPAATMITNALMAIKSGNCIIFSLHPRAMQCMSRTFELLSSAALERGLPENVLSCLVHPEKIGTFELMKHPAVSLVMVTGVQGMREQARNAGKTFIYGGTGNGPAFIERTADIGRAAEDIVLSKSFDCGIAPSAEQCVVVESCIAAQAREAFASRGAWFMTEQQAQRMAGLLFREDGRHRRDMVGVDATTLASRAGFQVPPGTRILVAERTHVSDYDAYNRELLAPILPWYEENDWMHACEKCIELLLFDRAGHTLSIHSSDDFVIRQFALRKPVARILVNTPACLGGMGMTTRLAPSLTLGAGPQWQSMTSDNVSPMNLIHIRRIGVGNIRPDVALAQLSPDAETSSTTAADSVVHGLSEDALRTAIRGIVQKLTEPSGAR